MVTREMTEAASVATSRWKHPDLLSLGLIFGVAVTVRLVFFLNAPIFFEGDARGYLLRAVEIASGEGFQFSLKRTPGYPLLIAAIFAMAGPSLGQWPWFNTYSELPRPCWPMAARDTSPDP
jgi:hypothetical protein